MNQIILNEKVYAEQCLRGDHVEEHIPQTLSILAKYYYHVCGYRKKKIYKKLMEYLRTNCLINDGELVMWENRAERYAANARKYELQEIDGVNITRSELDTIDGISGKVLRRLAFTMLCLAKFGNLKNQRNNGWVQMCSKDIFTLARISCKAVERDRKIGALYKLGLLEFSKRNDNLNCRVTYIDDDSDIILFISDFRELGYEYLKYCGENFVHCRECGILMHGNKNNTKMYCSRCAAPTVMGVKKMVCIDCGDEFEVSAKNNQSRRCPYCYQIYRRNYKRDKDRERYFGQHKKKMIFKNEPQNIVS